MDEEQQSYWETSGLAPAARWAAGLLAPQPGSLISRGISWARGVPMYGVTEEQQKYQAAAEARAQRERYAMEQTYGRYLEVLRKSKEEQEAEGGDEVVFKHRLILL